ncbi:prolipoprotein diacylglyceryl transferase [Anaerorhabdus sp.]|jgi:phosphatidylglycerol---prolipoprotein diacylglyceryl transferase|uniref:prolipoprotein diacylglyceryl transferase n=2 Tax=Anaerorhabdus sp. TaxID=1872524 RepID=UPI002FCBAAAD
MHNELFKIGGLTFYTYGFMIAIGIGLGYVVAQKRGKKLGMNVEVFDSLAIWLFGFGILGSKILYWITIIDQIAMNPSILFNLMDGYVVYGGIIGGIIGGYLYCKKHNLNFLEYFDLLVPSVALAQAFGRIGCFFAGCCYGSVTDSPIGITFPANSLAPAGIPLIPTQLFSSVFDFILFFVLITFARKKKTNGEVASLYLVLYSIGRFIIEIFRGDLIRGSVGTLSTSQFISILVFIVGITLFTLCRKSNVK